MCALVHVLKYDVVGVRSICSDVHRIPHLRTYAQRLISAQALEMILKRHVANETIEDIRMMRFCEIAYGEPSLLEFLASIFEGEIDGSSAAQRSRARLARTHFLDDPF